MSHVTSSPAPSSEQIPVELVALRERVQAQPAEVRAELEPMVDDALEHARFRSRVLAVARDAGGTSERSGRRWNAVSVESSSGGTGHGCQSAAHHEFPDGNALREVNRFRSRPTVDPCRGGW